MKTIYRLLEVGETIQEGDEFYSNTCHLWSSADSEKRGTVCKDHMPYRRRMNVAEIGETLYRRYEAGQGIAGCYPATYEPVTHWEVDNPPVSWRTVSEWGRQDKLRKENIEKLEKENGRLRAKLESLTDFMDAQANELEDKIEQLKKSQVRWAKSNDMSIWAKENIRGEDILVNAVGHQCLLLIPPAEKDEDLEAWKKYCEDGTPNPDALSCFRAGYRAAKKEGK